MDRTTIEPQLENCSEHNENYSAMVPIEADEMDEPQKQAFTFACSTLMAILCTIGAFGNIISAVIFTRRSMRSSINILLAGLSLVDLSVVAIAVPVFAIPGLNAYGQFGPLARLQMAIVFGLYQLAVIAQTCSAYLFVLITVERFFAVCHPLQVQRLFTIKRAKLAQVVVVSLSVMYNLCRFWEYRPEYDEDGQEAGYIRALRANGIYFLGYYTFLYLFVHFLIPFSIIAILNSRIASTIVVASTIRSQMAVSQNPDSRRQHKITRMIIVVTAIFASCNVTPFCLNLWEAVSPASFDFHRHGHEWHSFVAYVLMEVSNVLVVFNSSVNFVIYLVYCRKYRRMFTKFLSRFPRYGSRGRRRSSAGDTNRSLTTIGQNMAINNRRSSSTFRLFGFDYGSGFENCP